jgi:hypothetical protein
MTGLSAEARGFTSIQVKWPSMSSYGQKTTGGSPFTGYKIFLNCTTCTKSSITSYNVDNANTTNFNISLLNPGHNYTVVIRAENIYGEGELSDDVIVSLPMPAKLSFSDYVVFDLKLRDR